MTPGLVRDGHVWVYSPRLTGVEVSVLLVTGGMRAGVYGPTASGMGLICLRHFASREADKCERSCGLVSEAAAGAAVDRHVMLLIVSSTGWGCRGHCSALSGCAAGTDEDC